MLQIRTFGNILDHPCLANTPIITWTSQNDNKWHWNSWDIQWPIYKYHWKIYRNCTNYFEIHKQIKKENITSYIKDIIDHYQDLPLILKINECCKNLPPINIPLATTDVIDTILKTSMLINHLAWSYIAYSSQTSKNHK